MSAFFITKLKLSRHRKNLQVERMYLGFWALPSVFWTPKSQFFYNSVTLPELENACRKVFRLIKKVHKPGYGIIWLPNFKYLEKKQFQQMYYVHPIAVPMLNWSCATVFHPGCAHTGMIKIKHKLNFKMNDTFFNESIVHKNSTTKFKENQRAHEMFLMTTLHGINSPLT